ncbi:serine threonine kinase, partial [Paramuricea clavata]
MASIVLYLYLYLGVELAVVLKDKSFLGHFARNAHVFECKELQVLEGRTNAVWCLVLSHSQRHLASGSGDNTATIWNTDTFEQLKVLQVEGGNVYALDFSTDDQRLFTGSVDGNLRVWRVTTGERLYVIPAHDGAITSLCTTKDGLYIATASFDHTIKLWRADTLNFEATLVGHTDVVKCVVAA